MIKLLVVDDDVIIRRGISEGIPWSDHNFKVIGTAGDGETALEIIKDEVPDMIISDIRMPFMDGLELAEKVLGEHPRVKVVLLTGYEEYEYAKKAIDIQACEYLIKPINNKVLLQKAIEIGAQIEQETQYSRQIQEGMPLLRQRYLNKLVLGVSIQDFQSEMSFLKLDLVRSTFQIIIIKIDDLNSPRLLKRYLEKELIKFSVQNITDELLGRRGVTFNNGGDELIVIYNDDLEPNELFKDAYQFAELLLDKIMSYVKTTITIGMGGAYEGYSKISKSYEEACSSLAFRHYSGTNQIISVNETGLFSNANDLPLVAIKKELLSKVKLGMIKEALNIVNDLELELRREPLELSQIHLLAVELVIMVFQGIHEWGEEWENRKDFYAVCVELQDLETIRDIFNYMRELIKDIAMTAKNIRESLTKGLVHKAMQYIDEHYQDENLSLNEVAGEVFINPTYLSIIFKREKNIKFSEYLLEVRMRKAIQLLRKEKHKTYHIAQMVGYPNPQYFSVVFKKYTGLSPTEYRSQMDEEDA